MPNTPLVVGSYPITVTATDISDQSVSRSFTLTVVEVTEVVPEITYSGLIQAGTVMNFDWGLQPNPNSYPVGYFMYLNGVQSRIDGVNSYTLQQSDLGPDSTLAIRTKLIAPTGNINGTLSPTILLIDSTATEPPVEPEVSSVNDAPSPTGFNVNSSILSLVGDDALIQTTGNIWNNGFKTGNTRIEPNEWLPFSVKYKEPDTDSSGRLRLTFEISEAPYTQTTLRIPVDGSTVEITGGTLGDHFGTFAAISVVATPDGYYELTGLHRTNEAHDAGTWRVAVGPDSTITGLGVQVNSLSVTEAIPDIAPELILDGNSSALFTNSGSNEPVVVDLGTIFSDDGGVGNLMMTSSGLPTGSSVARVGNNLHVTLPASALEVQGTYPFTITADDGVNPPVPASLSLTVSDS